MQVENQSKVDNITEIDFPATENKDYTVTVYYQSLTEQKELIETFTTTVDSIISTNNDVSLFVDSRTISENGFTIVTNEANKEAFIEKYNGPETELSIPKLIQGYKVVDIGKYSFSGSSLRSVEIPDSVIRISDYAFHLCRVLTTVNIPNSVTYIGNNAFRICRSLNTINIPNSVINIGDEVFLGCESLRTVNIGDSVMSIGNQSFKNCFSLTKVKIGNSVTSIGDMAFEGCFSLSEINLPDSVLSIGEFAFNCCESLTTINLPNSLESLEYCLFDGCLSLKDIKIPDSIKKIDLFVFRGCTSLTRIYLSNSVVEIEEDAFNESGIQQVIVMCNDPFDFDIPGDSPLMNIKKSTNITTPLEWYRIVLKGNIGVKQNVIHSVSDKGKTVSLEDVFEDKGMREAIYKGKTGNELYTGNDIEIPENYFNLDGIDASIQYRLLGNPTSSNTKIANNQLYIGADERALDLRVNATVLNTTSQEVPIKILPLSSIEIVSEPLKQYIEGESYNPEGLVIKIRYHDGYEEKIAYNEETRKDFYFTYDKLSLSTKDQVISYGGQNVKHQLIILPKYIDQILKDDKHLISVQGIITRDGYLIVHKVENQYSAGLEDKKIIGEYEIEMIGEYKGKLFISFDVGADNNGRTVYVRYLNRDGEYRSIRETAINGKIGIYVDELSSFVIYADNELTDNPSIEINQNINAQEMSTVQTNDNTNIIIYIIIISTMISAIVLISRKRMKLNL